MKCIVCTVFIVFHFIIALPSHAVTRDSATWEGKYECGALPTDDGWIEKMGGANSYAAAADGLLKIDTLGSDQWPYWFRSIALDATKGITVEWKLRVNATEAGDVPSAAVFGVRPFAGTAVFDAVGFGFGETKVQGIGKTVAMDTGDDFHVYRMTIDGSGYQLYIDNAMQPAFEGPLKTTEASNMEAGIEFGDESTAPDASYQIDYIRWTASGALPPPATATEASQPLQAAARTIEWKKSIDEGGLVLAIPKASSRPALDGRIGQNEYMFAGTGFHDIRSGQYASKQSRYYVSYDDEALYFALQSPKAAELLSKASRRDDVVVSGDDSVEFFIVDDAPASQTFQIILNSLGVIYDQKNSDPSWNVKNAKFINQIDEHAWTVEAVIPFSDLGVEPPAPGRVWRINLCRSYAGATPLYTSMSPCRHTYLSPRRFAYLRFLDDGPRLALNSIGDLFDGNVDMAMDLDGSKSQSPVNVSVELSRKEDKQVLLSERYSANDPVSISLKKEKIAEAGSLNVMATSEQDGIIYAGTFPFSVSNDAFDLNYIYTNLQKSTLNVGLHVPARYLVGGLVRGRIRAISGEKTAAEQAFETDQPDTEVSIDIADLAPADYVLDVSFNDDAGKTLATLKDTYRRYPTSAAPWEGNQIGITSDVPKPWIPLKRNSDTVTLWDRTYAFDNRLLPAQITSRDREILAAPMTMRISIQGKSADIQDVRSLWTTDQPNLLVRAAEAQAGPIRIKTETRVEFDGFTWIKCTLASDGPVNVEQLTLDIPLKKEYTTLRYFGDYRMERTGALPAGTCTADLREKPLFWLGDETGGLQWVAESLPGWNCQDWSRSLEVIADEKPQQVVARLNLIDSPVVVNGVREISFGIQATPVKPVRPDWRSWRFRPWESSAPFNIECWFTEWTELVNYPDVSQLVPEKVEALKSMRAEGVKVLPYVSLGMTTPYSPEFKYYGEEWRQAPFNRIVKTTALDPQWKIWANRVTCNNSASYRDFFVQKVDSMMAALPMDGLYFDFGTSRICSNPLHGCGWTDNLGQPHPTLCHGARQNRPARGAQNRPVL